ncbi:Imm15 family immunity protein [Avibacterium avium]|uniref:Imm15 family immunity protein n=1 Tax=Avibacterium avium TaxID=751 RepID=UPI003BF8F293
MSYLKLLNNLMKKEIFYREENLIDLLKYPTEFEEIPIITRTGREKPFLEFFDKKQLNSFLLNFAIFHLNNIKLIAKKHLTPDELNKICFCLTYPNLDLFDLYGFYIPNICVFKKRYYKSLMNKDKLNVIETKWLNDSLFEIGQQSRFKIVYEKFNDEFGYEIFRIFLLDKSIP